MGKRVSRTMRHIAVVLVSVWLCASTGEALRGMPLETLETAQGMRSCRSISSSRLEAKNACSLGDSSTGNPLNVTYLNGSSITYLNGSPAPFNPGHHGWDVNADWVQSGPNHAECPIDREGGKQQTQGVWVTHKSKNVAQCQQEALDVGADYVSFKGKQCRVSKSCKNTYQRTVGNKKITINEVPKQSTGWKIYATGLSCTVPTLAKYPQATCNVVKCRGPTQNNSVVAGDLECDLFPRYTMNKDLQRDLRGSTNNGLDDSHTNMGRTSTGATCPDDLSSGLAYLKHNDGWGICSGMGGQQAQKATNYYVLPDNLSQGANGVISKSGTRQVPGADKKTGVIFVKRTRCDKKGKCAVFKSGFCIKCAANIWPSACAGSTGLGKGKNCARRRTGVPEELNTNANFQNVQSTGKFMQCCVLGRDKYPGGACPAATQQLGGAFKDGALKPEYECTNTEYLARAEAVIASA